jgi:hypothetical protein
MHKAPDDGAKRFATYGCENGRRGGRIDISPKKLAQKYTEAHPLPDMSMSTRSQEAMLAATEKGIKAYKAQLQEAQTQHAHAPVQQAAVPARAPVRALQHALPAAAMTGNSAPLLPQQQLLLQPQHPQVQPQRPVMQQAAQPRERQQQQPTVLQPTLRPQLSTSTLMLPVPVPVPVPQALPAAHGSLECSRAAFSNVQGIAQSASIVAVGGVRGARALQDHNGAAAQTYATPVPVPSPISFMASREPALSNAVNGQQDLDCKICLEYLHAEKIACPPCGHIFHLQCLIDTITVLKKCPVCERQCHPAHVMKLYV